MTLTQISDFLMGQESKFSQQYDQAADSYEALKEHLSSLDKEVSKKQVDQQKVKKRIDSTKAQADMFMK